MARLNNLIDLSVQLFEVGRCRADIIRRLSLILLESCLHLAHLRLHAAHLRLQAFKLLLHLLHLFWAYSRFLGFSGLNAMLLNLLVEISDFPPHLREILHHLVKLHEELLVVLWVEPVCIGGLRGAVSQVGCRRALGIGSLGWCAAPKLLCKLVLHLLEELALQEHLLLRLAHVGV